MAWNPAARKVALLRFFAEKVARCPKRAGNGHEGREAKNHCAYGVVLSHKIPNTCHRAQAYAEHEAPKRPFFTHKCV
jgi:hypothetical protein